MHIEQRRQKDLDRKHRSDLGILSERTLRRKVIERFMDRGTPAELVIFLEGRYNWKVSPDAVRMVISRLRKDNPPKRWIQLSLWPAKMFTVPAPPPRIVHWHRKHRPDGVQLSLDLFPELQKLKAA